MFTKKQNNIFLLIVTTTFLIPFVVFSMKIDHPLETIPEQKKPLADNFMVKNDEKNNPNANNNYDIFLMHPPKKITRRK